MKTTEYESIPTTIRTRTTQSTNHRSSVFLIILCLGFVFIIIGIPLTIFGSLEYHKVNSFIRPASSCRVNSISTQRRSEWKSTSFVYPIWNVDVVKQSSNAEDQEKKLFILRSDLHIRGKGYDDHITALKNAEKFHSIGKIYQCYVTRRLLISTIHSEDEINPTYSIQWEPPKRRPSLIMLSAGLGPLVIGIFLLIIRVLLSCQH